MNEVIDDLSRKRINRLIMIQSFLYDLFLLLTSFLEYRRGNLAFLCFVTIAALLLIFAVTVTTVFLKRLVLFSLDV